MRLFLLDNYDSFTFNLVLYLQELGAEVVVARADQVDPREAVQRRFDGFVISPGPGHPRDAATSMALVRACFEKRKPLLGVCLGHQCIAAEFGARIVRAERVMHGKVSRIAHDRSGVFEGLPSPLAATRYHSLVVDKRDLPADLHVTAEAEDGTLQGIAHRDRPIHGVQFHPESIASEQGYALLGNFLSLVEQSVRAPAVRG